MFFRCHTNCDTGHPFIIHVMVTPEDPWHCLALDNGAVTTCFHDLDPSQLGFEHPTFRMQGKRSNRLRHCGGACVLSYVYNESGYIAPWCSKWESGGPEPHLACLILNMGAALLHKLMIWTMWFYFVYPLLEFFLIDILESIQETSDSIKGDQYMC